MDSSTGRAYQFKEALLGDDQVGRQEWNCCSSYGTRNGGGYKPTYCVTVFMVLVFGRGWLLRTVRLLLSEHLPIPARAVKAAPTDWVAVPVLHLSPVVGETAAPSPIGQDKTFVLKE